MFADRARTIHERNVPVLGRDGQHQAEQHQARLDLHSHDLGLVFVQPSLGAARSPKKTVRVLCTSAREGGRKRAGQGGWRGVGWAHYKVRSKIRSTMGCCRRASSDSRSTQDGGRVCDDTSRSWTAKQAPLQAVKGTTVCMAMTSRSDRARPCLHVCRWAASAKSRPGHAHSSEPGDGVSSADVPGLPLCLNFFFGPHWTHL